MKKILASENIPIGISAIINDSITTRNQKIAELLPIIAEMRELNPAIFNSIDSTIKGTYGSEYLISQGDYQPIIEFYQFLNQKFPDLAEVLLSLGDIYLLDKQYSNSFDAFNKAFYKHPLLLFEAPGELGDYIEKYGSDSQKIYYRISLVRALFLDENFDDAKEEYQDIIQFYGENNEVMKEYLQEPKMKAEISRLLN